MIRIRISAHRIAFALVLIVLPLSAIVCSSSPLRVQGNATATASPPPALSIATLDSSRFSLQVSWEGSYSPPTGAITATYGPDTAMIPLSSSGDTLAGSYQGTWHTGVTGTCTAAGSPPVGLDVTANVQQSGDLDFSVKRTIVWTWDTVCPGLGAGSSSSSPQTYIFTFTVPPEDGASKTFNLGGPSWIFVLKKQEP